MTQRTLERTVLPDGTVRLSAEASAFELARPKHDVLVVTIGGYDKGQFGTTPFDEIGALLGIAAPLELFIDARNAIGATVRVSQDWTSFLSRRKSDFRRVHVLAGSKMVELTVEIARHLSRTGSLIQIYSDPDLFAAQLAAATRSR